MDVEELAIAIDIGHLQTHALRETKATGIDGGEAHAVDCNPHVIENAPDLATAQNDRELLLTLRASDTEHRPLAAERVLIEELDAAQRDGMRDTSDLLDGTQVQQVFACP
jgi:hypothetical protein